MATKIGNLWTIEVIYHSKQWQTLVSKGWITGTVSGYLAKMVKQA